MSVSPLSLSPIDSRMVAGVSFDQCPVTGEVAWESRLLDQYPILAVWFANDEVRKTAEGISSAGSSSYSQRIFGKKFDELDRTLGALRCLEMLIDGSYRAYHTFTADQPLAVKLSRQSFATLHQRAARLLNNGYGISREEMIATLKAALVLGDIGKSEVARSQFLAHGIAVPDHDDFHAKVMELLSYQPDLLPLYAQLPINAQQLLIKAADIAHFGHITHAEGGADMFSKLEQSRLAAVDPLALEFALFVHLCDVGGALWHVNGESSLAYTENTHQAMEAMAAACRMLKDTSKTGEDAYHFYLSHRASLLGFTLLTPEDKVLTRIGAMIRVFSPAEGDILKQAFYQLPAAATSLVTEQFDPHLIPSGVRTPTYIPAVLVNVLQRAEQIRFENTLFPAHERGLAAAVSVLPFIARVLKNYQELIASGSLSAAVPLNFNPVAATAKTTPPQIIATATHRIDNEGQVTVVLPMR